MDLNIQSAAAALRRGDLVGMPTETVYGLAGLAHNERAVANIFAAKRRPTFDPLIVHVASLEQALELAEFSTEAIRLAERCWPGPLTVVLPRRPGKVADLVTSGLPSVGLRCPDHDLARQLISASGAVAAPSANLFGRISPTTAQHVSEQLGDQVAYIVDGGPCRVGVESTVLRLDPEPIILRPGGYSREYLSEVLGQHVRIADRLTVEAGLPAEAPGLLASHYAPRQPLTIIPADQPWPDEPHVACLSFQRAVPRGKTLSPQGNIIEAATNLFSYLRELESADYEALVAEWCPAEGLGLAINDRLRRAAGLG